MLGRRGTSLRLDVLLRNRQWEIPMLHWALTFLVLGFDRRSVRLYRHSGRVDRDRERFCSSVFLRHVCGHAPYGSRPAAETPFSD